MRPHRLLIVPFIVLTTGVSAAGQAGAGAFPPAAVTGAKGDVQPNAAADVRFMQGMVGHRGQAVVIASWAPTHGASEEVRQLAEHIVVSQNGGIATISAWLRERNETVPDLPTIAPAARGMNMPVMDVPGALTPGMLTVGQLRQLNGARGADFDRLFLKYMIQHHAGALKMIEQLLATPGGGLEENISKFASAVRADQSGEIDRMRAMLATRQQDFVPSSN